MAGFCTRQLVSEHGENKDVWVDRRPNLAPSCAAAVLFDVRQATLSCTCFILRKIKSA